MEAPYQCAECGFDSAGQPRDGIAEQFRSAPERVRHLFDGGARHLFETEPHLARLTRRPSPTTWSAVEYGCHLRDVLLLQRDRLYLALIEECPAFAPLYRDDRARLDRYNDQPAAGVLAQLTPAADLLGWALDRLGPEQWSRRCIYNYPEPTERDVEWLAWHTLHEIDHHLLDLRRGLC